MVVSWTLSMQRAPTRVVIEGGGAQARANLNGGELDKEPFLRDKRGQTTMTLQRRKTKDAAQPPDRPKWRRAGARGCQKCRIRKGLETHPRTNLNGGDLVRSTFPIITFPFTLAFMATLVLALILAFVAPFQGRIFTFLGCNGEKRSILSWGGGNTFGAFGWALACAQIALKRRLAFASIYCKRRNSRGGRVNCRRWWFR